VNGDPSRALLNRCLSDELWTPDLLAAAVRQNDGRTFLREVVEPLGDAFEPRLCDVYARLFAEIIDPRQAPELVARYRRIRGPKPMPPSARKVFVLSRITLGADVAVTSVFLDAARRRYPDAVIVFVGPRKNWELFAGDRRIHHLDAPYARSGALADRMAASFALRNMIDEPDAIVLDPDSRLTQLGLIPVTGEERYFFFESRSFGGDTSEPLGKLAAEWLGDPEARAWVAPLPVTTEPVDVTVSLGVGENMEKRLGNEFEAELMGILAGRGFPVLVDKGGSAEEKARVERVLQPGMRSFEGPFAPFAAEIIRSKLYVGYDSAGQHVAAAAGVPLITIFTGFPNERFFARWRPWGSGTIEVIRGDAQDPLSELRRAVERLKPALHV
jgi:hypothetical protein